MVQVFEEARCSIVLFSGRKWRLKEVEGEVVVEEEEPVT